MTYGSARPLAYQQGQQAMFGNEAANPRCMSRNKPLKPLTVKKSIVETAHQQALDIHNRRDLRLLTNWRQK